ncbi:hypothetical protein HDV00_000411 [Rhizophlyctis rosea]|nr:hypothetical protein HDV00_000411 [Rhizophlyctis rosea]
MLGVEVEETVIEEQQTSISISFESKTAFTFVPPPSPATQTSPPNVLNPSPDAPSDHPDAPTPSLSASDSGRSIRLVVPTEITTTTDAADTIPYIPFSHHTARHGCAACLLRAENLRLARERVQALKAQRKKGGQPWKPVGALPPRPVTPLLHHNHAAAANTPSSPVRVIDARPRVNTGLDASGRVAYSSPKRASDGAVSPPKRIAINRDSALSTKPRQPWLGGGNVRLKEKPSFLSASATAPNPSPPSTPTPSTPPTPKRILSKASQQSLTRTKTPPAATQPSTPKPTTAKPRQRRLSLKKSKRVTKSSSSLATGGDENDSKADGQAAEEGVRQGKALRGKAGVQEEVKTEAVEEAKEEEVVVEGEGNDDGNGVTAALDTTNEKENVAEKDREGGGDEDDKADVHGSEGGLPEGKVEPTESVDAGESPSENAEAANASALNDDKSAAVPAEEDVKDAPSEDQTSVDDPAEMVPETEPSAEGESTEKTESSPAESDDAPAEKGESDVVVDGEVSAAETGTKEEEAAEVAEASDSVDEAAAEDGEGPVSASVEVEEGDVPASAQDEGQVENVVQAGKEEGGDGVVEARKEKEGDGVDEGPHDVVQAEPEIDDKVDGPAAEGPAIEQEEGTDSGAEEKDEEVEVKEEAPGASQQDGATESALNDERTDVPQIAEEENGKEDETAPAAAVEAADEKAIDTPAATEPSVPTDQTATPEPSDPDADTSMKPDPDHIPDTTNTIPDTTTTQTTDPDPSDAISEFDDTRSIRSFYSDRTYGADEDYTLSFAAESGVLEADGESETATPTEGVAPSNRASTLNPLSPPRRIVRPPARRRRRKIDMRDLTGLAKTVDARLADLERHHAVLLGRAPSSLPSSSSSSTSLTTPPTTTPLSSSPDPPTLATAKTLYITSARDLVDLSRAISTSWRPIAKACPDKTISTHLLAQLAKLETLASQLRAVTSTKAGDVGDRDLDGQVLWCARNVVGCAGRALEDLEAARMTLFEDEGKEKDGEEKEV